MLSLSLAADCLWYGSCSSLGDIRLSDVPTAAEDEVSEPSTPVVPERPQMPETPTLSVTPVEEEFLEGQTTERPAPTHSQGTWAATSFAREYLDLGPDVPHSPEERHSAPAFDSSFLDFGSPDSPSLGKFPVSAPACLVSFSTTSLSPAPSETSFIDFGDRDAEAQSVRNVTTSQSQYSFIDWSPPTSPTFPAVRNSIQVQDVDEGVTAVLGEEDDFATSLPPTPTTLYHPRYSQVLGQEGNRDSYLSIESAMASNSNSRTSRTSFHSVGSGSAYSEGGAHSNASNTSLLNVFPVPPVPIDEPLEAGAESDDEQDHSLLSVPSIATLRPRRSRSLPAISQSTLSLTNTSNWTVESTDSSEDGVRRHPAESSDDDEGSDDDDTDAIESLNHRPFSNASFLDFTGSPERVPAERAHAFRPAASSRRVSSAGTTATEDLGSRRWSGSSFLTFFSGGSARGSTVVPLPPPPPPVRRERCHERTSSDPALYHPLRRGNETPEERR